MVMAYNTIEADDRQTDKADHKTDSIERLAAMTIEEVDDLPYGFIVLDAEGQVLLYNRYESRMSRIAPEQVVGQNFFRDIAPCTRVEAFYGRFRALVSDVSRQSDTFAFRFHFLHGAQNVTVQFARAPDVDSSDAGVPSAKHGAPRIFMTVMRRILDGTSYGPLKAVRLDSDQGRLVGPLGPLFPLTGSQLHSILGLVGPSSSREFGREFGRAIAALATEAAQQAGETLLKDAPRLLVASALDEALAGSGFGRLALDLTPQRATGVIGCLIRPAIELPSKNVAALYEGLLESALGMAVDGALTARCIDERDLNVLPWRFAVAPAEHAAMLERRSDESSEDLARRLGLLTDED
jgi:photoactive yellow protein